jgi:hypothetical protein
MLSIHIKSVGSCGSTMIGPQRSPEPSTAYWSPPRRPPRTVPRRTGLVAATRVARQPAADVECVDPTVAEITCPRRPDPALIVVQLLRKGADGSRTAVQIVIQPVGVCGRLADAAPSLVPHDMAPDIRPSALVRYWPPLLQSFVERYCIGLTTRWYFAAASTILLPSQMLWEWLFHVDVLAASHAHTASNACQWSGVQ